MSRFYVPKKNVSTKKNEIIIDGEEAHHLLDVMRLKGEDRVVVFDGTGLEYPYTPEPFIYTNLVRHNYS